MANLTKKQAHQIYMQVKKDLTGKTIKAFGKVGQVAKVFEHYGQGAVCLVKFENGTEGMVHPTTDEIDIIETYYTISSDVLLAAEVA